MIKHECTKSEFGTVFMLKNSCMDWLPKVLGFISSGVHSNWWGLSCPSHCFGARLPSLVCTFLLGLSFGFISGCLVCAWTFGFLPHPAAALSSPAPRESSFERVRAYAVDEQRGALAL